MSESNGKSRWRPSREEVRALGRAVQRGDVFINRFAEHGTPPYVRQLEVVGDVPRRAFFILKVIANAGRPEQIGAVTWMRTRTLMSRYDRLPFSGGEDVQQ